MKFFRKKTCHCDCFKVSIESAFSGFLFIELTLNKLDRLYTNSRYPSEFGLLPDGEPTLEEAQKFYEFALNIYEQVKNILEKIN